jgi:hypothetical protein
MEKDKEVMLKRELRRLKEEEIRELVERHKKLETEKK